MSSEQRQLLQQIWPLLEREDVSALRGLLGEQRSSDIAEVVELVDNEQRRIIFDVLEKSVSAEVLEKVDEATRSELFELLEVVEVTNIISELDLDDAADLLGELREEKKV